MLPFFLVHCHYLVFLQDFPIIVSVDPLLLPMLAGVAGVPPLVPVYFQHFAQLLLHLLHVLLIQSEHYLLVVAHAHAYGYNARDYLCSTCLEVVVQLVPLLHEPTIQWPFHGDPESYRTSFPTVAMEQQG